MEEISKLLEKGKNNMDSGNFQEALSFFEQALLINPQDPDLWNLKGTALRSMGRYEEAIESFNKSLEIEPRNKHS
ncbi:MAG: tetratricopeptide repeat protein [Nitrosopumilaceae archaeon]|nr:tetratricopeptide repeat protein [Nitrosopumilaceae archaeon]